MLPRLKQVTHSISGDFGSEKGDTWKFRAAGAIFVVVISNGKYVKIVKKYDRFQNLKKRCYYSRFGTPCKPDKASGIYNTHTYYDFLYGLRW